MSQRHRASFIAAAVVISYGVASPAGAQGDGHDHEHGPGSGHRLTEQHRWSDPEGRLMAYYSAALAFSPVAAPSLSAPWALTVGLEASYLPRLSEAQRSAGFSKTEYTNLAPVIPRPRLGVSLPFGVSVEGSWIPPVEALGVTANLISGAVSRPFAVRGLLLTPRVAGSTGWVRGAMTCNDDLMSGSDGDVLFYQHVCHGMESEDRFEPRSVSGELVASRGMRGGTVTPYLGGGVRSEIDRFEVGVRYTDGSTDLNHPVLTLDLTRGYGFLGATWTGSGRGAVTGEVFYAPGSLVTFRLQASLRFLHGS